MHGRMSRAGWTTVAFGDVVRLSKERSSDPTADGFDRFVGLEHITPNDLKIREWGDVADGTTFTSVFRPGQVLFGKRRAYQRKVALADFAGVCSGDIYVLEAQDGLLPELLPFICQTNAFFDHAVGTSAGSLSPRTNWKSLADYEFALPPLEEQRRIVEVLCGRETATQALLSAADTALTVEYAFLVEAFGGSYAAPRSGWPLVPLSEVADIQTGLAKGRRPDDTTTTRPYLRVANVKDGRLDLAEMKEIVVEERKVERYLLRYGDVLMTEGGDLDKLGRGTVWQGEIEGCLHQNHVFAVRPHADALDPWYLAAVARSPFGRSFFLAAAKRSSNLASINKTQLSGLKIPLPTKAVQMSWLESYQAIRQAQLAIAARVLAIRQSLSTMSLGNDT